MAAKRILRVRRTDVDEATPAYALLSVESAGPEPLDVKLVGTEGENVFAASVREAQIRNFKSRASDDHEWEVILRSGLLQHPADGDDAKLLENLEIVASVIDQQLKLTVRKNIEGITQRLGVIPLPEDRNTEIEFFEWTAIAVNAASVARGDARDLQNKCEAQQVTINKLKSQLDDLIQAKQDHEGALLAKFQDLLNAKKLKIRDQQRLLAGAKVDPAAAAAVEQARGTTRHTTRPRKAGPSRASKRKAIAKTPVHDSDSELDSRMDVDDDDARAKLEVKEEIAEPATEQSDLETTEDEDDDDDDLDAMPASRPSKTSEGSRGKAIETATPNQSSHRQKSPEALPPRRELPFPRNQSKQPRNEPVKKAPATRTVVQDDDESTTDDDEL
ncbi:DNA double-strand break repair and VJ recombination XRCC4 [Lasiodiplodia theobromae]|uniref:DNA repair protein XRCC4 n=1 Tax=Lasiodiplodia theobromae TaxID=45133 RepID=A0A5N5DQW5_9PEZI|nr:DNA double-strand break repair protein [Lasiodiplodia theobromae]KAB2579751.1 hypothetical protein DBV05_g1740 [Lasiodiplodia theobromae]KAF4542863.1 DNA double-strand break repair protein [Lasiodiplodia theobromae]KAF9633940.1 DNA double-strand break repair and VJ recombination XRCC4 [Lasiodiplodia theobromae]